ncbi:hypothetical protein OKA04_21975 [Luteolibacter flavescens]|uniref:Uncharacterized protein n=1 Tax=Luteolibacter flavescens TaxID=1859460 RepID=A0ABT3FW14_9BACT|nr:hypothetical protein [Luteolibacter flavescens]MCW1887421.1 hypothetical protein [Luteolibacter flavescens]
MTIHSLEQTRQRLARLAMGVVLVASMTWPVVAREPGPPGKPGTTWNAPHHGTRQTTPPRAAQPKRAEPIRRGMQARPDPRYRPAANFAELQAIAGEVARASGRKINWKLRHGENPGPLVRIRGTLADCTITIHPLAAQKLPANTWAFLFGHEFAHLTEQLGVHSETNPEVELKADIAGARYAMAAGFRLDAFLGWVLTEPNKETSSHGSLHRRVDSIAKRFGIRQEAIRAQAQLYSRYRARH